MKFQERKDFEKGKGRRSSPKLTQTFHSQSNIFAQAKLNKTSELFSHLCTECIEGVLSIFLRKI